MFKVSTSQFGQSYPAEVRVDVPDEDNVPHTCIFTAFFKRLPQEQLDDLSQRYGDKKVTDSGVLDEVMTGWKDVADEHGTALEFTPENLIALCNMHPTRGALVTTYFDTLKGAKRKNSSVQRNGGQKP